MPNIAQQDYIIIDWEGKSASDAAKKAEVNAILKKLYLANPLSILSVVFKNFEGNVGLYIMVSAEEAAGAVNINFIIGDDATPRSYAFSIE